MHKPVALFALPAVVLAVGIYGAPKAGTQETTGSQTTATSGKTSVTGCLQKGDEPGEFAITGQDGKTYGLHASKSVDLSKHLGHKVTVTGTMKPESEEKGKHETKESQKTAEAGDIRVTSLKHISETCP